MSTQIPCQLCITCVEESANQPVLAMALHSSTLEDMGLPAIDVLEN
jgi:hypothetical protein